MANPFLVLGGVAVGVITAGIGVLQVPGWIDSANDSLATGDLAQVALSQEAASTQVGAYTSLANLESGTIGGEKIGVVMKRSDGVKLAAVSNASAERWAAVAVSRSGYVFLRTSDSTKVFKSDRKYDAATPLSASDFAGIPAGLMISGTTAAPLVAFGSPLPTTTSDWAVANGTLADWSSIAAPAAFTHNAGAAHSVLLTKDATVDQAAGFTVSAEVLLGSGGTPLAGIALGNGSQTFTIALDGRDGPTTTGSTASVQMRRGLATSGALGLAGAVGLQRDAWYRLVVTASGTLMRVTVTTVDTGAVVADTTTTSPYADFSGITRIGVYAHNSATIRDLAIQ